MRIDRNQALQYYEKTKAVSSVKTDTISSSDNTAKTDRISISSEAARQAELGNTVQHIAADVETSVSNAKLQQLSAQIEAGEYNIPTHRLVSSIINWR